MKLGLFFAVTVAALSAVFLPEARGASTSTVEEASPSQADEASLDRAVQKLGGPSEAEKGNAGQSLELAGPSAIPALLKSLDSANDEIKARAMFILRNIVWKSKSLLNDSIASEIGRKCRSEKSRGVRMELISTLRTLPGVASTRELKWIAANDPDEWARRSATHYVSDVSHDNEAAFYKAQTKDNGLAVRLAAYTELAELGDYSGRDLALSVIKGQYDDSYRSEALDLLGRIANPEDIPLLKGIADSPSETFSRSPARWAYMRAQLRQMPIQNRLPSLLKSLDSSSRDIRYWAYTELSGSSDPKTNAALRKYVSEPGHVGYKEAYDALSVR